LDPNTAYYYRAWSYDTDSGYYSDGYSEDFETTQANMGPPTDFTITEIGVDTVSITWTKDPSATETLIRAKLGGYPIDTTDGEEVYNDVGTSTTDSGLALENTTYYYRAWSWKVGGYSDNYVEGNIGGENMIILAVSIVVLGLTVAGFVKKNGPLMLTSSLGWVLFAFLMYNQSFANAFMNTGLLMFGGAMAIVCAFLSYTTWASGRRRPSLEDEQNAYRKQILKITRRGR
ncbi:hypothetical protein LCGC14_2636060, partial [marine sediment metagenome]